MSIATITRNFTATSTIPLLAPLILLISGCTITKPDDNYQHFDSPIIIEMKQDLFTEHRQLILQCRTEIKYSTIGYLILSNWTRSGKEIALHFTGIEGPQIGGAETDYARTIIEIGYLPLGVYDLMLNVNEFHVSAALTVTEEYWKISGGNTKWTILPRSRLWRIPTNIIWGLAGYTDELNLPVLLTFYNSLLASGADYVVLPRGDYGEFTIGNNGVIGQPHLEPGHTIGGRHFNAWYIYEYIGAYETLRDLVKNLGESHSDSIHVSLYLPDGDQYHSSLHNIYPGR